MTRHRMRFFEARRALRELFSNPDDTAQAFRAVALMSGGSGERLLRRFRRSESGARMLREKRELVDVLGDLDRLQAMPEGSLGRGIADFYSTEEISAQGLAAASEIGLGAGEAQDLDEDEAFFFRRLRDLHDVFHVLTGYGRDVRGEVAVLAFTYSQTRNRGIAFLVLSVLRRAGLRSEMGQLIRQGYRRGRRSSWLVDQDWETLLPQSLAELRERFSVGHAPRYTQVRSAGAPAVAG